MDEIAQQEKNKYDRIWTSYPEYRQESPADYLTNVFLSCFQDEIQDGESAIDFGCGPGRSAKPLLDSGLKVHLIDISENCLDPEVFMMVVKGEIQFTNSSLWDLPEDLAAADWGLCFDVMEHLPREKIDDVLRNMARRMKKGGLFSIYLQEDQFGCMVGEKLHLTIETVTWWKERLSRYFSIDRELLSDETAYVVAVKTKR